MANPQIEDGHIDIANDIVEHLSLTNLSPYESRVLWFILRKTYGWHKKSDRISYTQFEEGTGLKRWHIARTIKRLLKRQIITILGNGYQQVYSLQKDYEQWQSLPKQVTTKSLPLQEKSLPKEVTKSLPKQVNTKETKETNKRNIFAIFEQKFKTQPPPSAYPRMEDAENNYPLSWITEAFDVAVKQKAFNWGYVEKVLKTRELKGSNAKDESPGYKTL